jgi:hypothetical protein
MSSHESGFVRLPTLLTELSRIPDATVALELLRPSPTGHLVVERLDCQCKRSTTPGR